ncbi:MAG TPA: hypothetical protein VMD25_14260 [Acidobacteriaceae bacterium]|nr:hypothetical protein [Acidobacteriaceae bacterium]
MRAHRDVSSFPAADEDYFHDMDGGLALTPEEIKGRNMWLVWTGGNDRFWDTLGVSSFGALDFVKILSSHPSLKYSRDDRWSYFGLINEPCFIKATGPDPQRYGLWLDKRDPDCPPDPFENETKYPGVRIGARGENLPAGSYYGWASGIVGLRLFPNPAFDAAAAKKWDPVRYYTDPSYYNDRNLIRPYRVGMSCAFCHVGPNPVKPPADPEHPAWENLSSNVGAQYFWLDRIFDWQADPSNYVFQLFHSQRPGTLDTSLVSTDNINNPRTMNAIYDVGPRLNQALRFGKETLAGGSINNKQLNDFVPASSPLAQYFVSPATAYSPRVLKDGADSVGVLGALNRVYLNIGLFSEEWLLHFNALVGGKQTTPIEIAVARRNSVYWQATEAQSPNMALFFLASTAPHKLKDAPGGTKYLTADAETLNLGKTAFADRCARCHSSKLPTPAPGLDPGGCSGPDYMKCWTAYWQWTETSDFRKKMEAIVKAPDFLDENFLSAEFRVPVTLLQTNACSPLATNAIRGNIWDNFSSETYKDLPSVGTITYYDPFNGKAHAFKMPAGGRGYTRPASLISLWSTAPYLLNNSVGRLNPNAPNDDWNPSPSVDNRMAAFQDAITKMLWPERRDKDPVIGNLVGAQVAGSLIDRTTTRSYIRIAPGYVPDNLKGLTGIGHSLLPSVFEAGGIQIGPIPAGTPVDLLANIDLLDDDADLAGKIDHDKKLLSILLRLKHDLEALGPNPSDDDARKVFANLAEPLMQVSKCPDFIVNRGHYFGTSYAEGEPPLSDKEKLALIEYLKTF